jgi:hypothetical protein
MGCPCKKNQQSAPAQVRENKQAPQNTPIKRLGSVRRLRREIK